MNSLKNIIESRKLVNIDKHTVKRVADGKLYIKVRPYQGKTLKNGLEWKNINFFIGRDQWIKYGQIHTA